MPLNMPKPMYATITCGANASERYPRSVPSAPSIMAYRAGSFPLSRSWPAGKATAAWKKIQTPISQKMCPLSQRWASCRVSSADVNAYSEELMPIMPIQGKSTMVQRGRPMMSRSVSPSRYRRPLRSVTSL